MKRKPHAWVENLVIGAAVVLALIIAYFMWPADRRGSAPSLGERSIPIPLLPSPPKAPVHELQGSGTTSELRELPAVRTYRRSSPAHKIDVPSPDKK